MVACEAGVLPVAVGLIWMQQPFDQLKEQLQRSIDDEDSQSAFDVISKLENVQVTKEILEGTRIGYAVNDARRRSSEWSPLLAKRCRVLIKQWQKLADLRPPSSCGSSSGGTPGLISPAVRAGLTPRTPASRVTSTGLSLPGSNASPSSMCPPNGGYAPARRLESPRNGGLIKPGLISSDSSRSPNEDNIETNSVKRRLDDTNLVNGSQAKRPKTEASLLADRRKDVQSTSELVAKLSENLPQHMAVDFNAKIAMDPNVDEVPITPTTVKKTKRKDQQTQQPEMIQKPPSEQVVDKTELVHRFLDSSVPVTVVSDQPEQVAPRNWYDVLPGLNELSDQMADSSRSVRLCSSDDSLRQGLVLQGLGRENRDVFVLPYLDVGMPDFLEFSLPDSQQFIADPRL